MLLSSAHILMLASLYATSTAEQASDNGPARNGFARLTAAEEAKCLDNTIGPEGGYPNWEARSDDGSWFYPIEGDNE